EGFPTFFTFRRFYPTVSLLVLNKVGVPTKGLPAFTTLIGSFSSVNSMMFDK
ncbi:hypothetical protein DBR06_SOUSAS9810053, partial [Sousa chinensis]